MPVTEPVSLLCLAVVVLSLSLVLSLLSVPILVWRVLRQADQLSNLEAQITQLSKTDGDLRRDMDKVDLVLEGILGGGRVP